MRYLKILLATVLGLSGLVSQAQAQTQTTLETHSALYNQACLELADMLDGKIPLSIRRAVFLAEWAYLDGEPDYDAYCRSIDSTACWLKGFIRANRLEQYKTGGNFALFEYFSRPSAGNGYKPYTYDYEDFGGMEDFTKGFVTKLMRTHTGQCRSLPFYYKILADAIGAEAHITLAPQHYFIRHRDEIDPNRWVNVELTTHSLSREIWLIESFGITDNAIRNKVYLYPLTDEETVALLLSELMMGYVRKYRDYDDLLWLSALKSLEHYPQNITALWQKANVINLRLINHLASNGGVMDERGHRIDEEWLSIYDHIRELGWEEMNEATYERLTRGVEETMKKQGLDPSGVRPQVEEMRKSQHSK